MCSDIHHKFGNSSEEFGEEKFSVFSAETLMTRNLLELRQHYNKKLYATSKR